MLIKNMQQEISVFGGVWLYITNEADCVKTIRAQ